MVALVIIYNHQFLKNIEILEQIYSKRFSNIYHLVPFYNGTKSNVIPVYENSYYFQGYVAQGVQHFFKDEYEHYVFIADDLFLNPIINEWNYKEIFCLSEKSCFLPDFINLHKIEWGWWPRTAMAYKYKTKVSGVEVKNLLPSYEEALDLFHQHNLEIEPLRFNDIWEKPSSLKEWYKKLFVKGDRSYIFRSVANICHKKKYRLDYPMVGSYSDIFILSSDSIRQFANYCGIFAATKMFVELAIPTAMVLSSKIIINQENMHLKGLALWTTKQLKILDEFKNDLNLLINNFPANYIFLHPIKVSKWNFSHN